VTLEPGRSVWVVGWPKSKSATYTVQRVRPDGTVDVWREHRGRGRLHTVTADRITGRRDKRVTPGK
jgi:hypothetical protein